MTLIEMLVAMGVFALLGTLLLGFAISTGVVRTKVESSADLTSDARLSLERMSRELRQAREIDAVQYQTASATTTAITFWIDFNGNGLRDLAAADPEVLTYRWDPATLQLSLTANDASGTSVTRPVLAGRVTTFDLKLGSSLWQYDLNGDGTDWAELDAAGGTVGNKNGKPDGPELKRIDLVSVQLVVSSGGSAQTFLMKSDLRNLAQS